MKSLLQTPEWASFKVSQGWKSHEIDGAYILEKPFPFGKSFLYSPEAEYANTNLQKILQKLQNDIKKRGTIFYRLEILDEFDEKIIANLKKHGFVKSFEELQPEWRQIIDISKSEEEILAQMKPKGRYNIKVAQKHKVEVTVCPIDRLVDGIEIFYDLYRQTGKLQKFDIRSKKYFLDLVKALYPKGEAVILIARYNHIPLSALIITFYDKVASYLYGGTSWLHKNVMAPYVAHWQAVKLAKEKGCEKYDLLAVSPEHGERKTENGKRYGNQKTENSHHKYDNLTRFKEQFGGRKVHLVGSWDMVYRPGWYKIFRLAERLRRR